MSKALSVGLLGTIPLIIGIIVGDLVFLLFSIFGLAFVAESFTTLFLLIKYLGALYLIYLGIKMWNLPPISQNDITKTTKESRDSFLGGLSITLGNPKVILFYLGFLPTFVNLNALSYIDNIIIACIVSFVLGSVMLAYAFLVLKTRNILKNQNRKNRLNKISSLLMVSIGTTLLVRN